MRRATRVLPSLALSLLFLVLAGGATRAVHAEGWLLSNHPSNLGGFEYKIDSLPLVAAAARAPWPGDYWSTARDSIDYRWDGGLPSPAEKVEQALGLAGFASGITNRYGVYGNALRPACDVSTDCASLQDGSLCAAPRGATGPRSGRCIPGW